MKNTLFTLLLAFSLGVQSASEAPNNKAPNNKAPKNIIYMIGDGMGPAYTTAYRYYKDDKATKQVEKTIFDTLLTGMAQTAPDDDTIVTDSAAGATALATATKTYNGAIAVDTNKKPLKTMLQLAKSKGLTTALVASSQINHATPASFVAHNESRHNYDEIANDFIDHKINGKLAVDLMFGGGIQYFVREDRNLVNEFIEFGYQYEDSLEKISQINQLPAIGLFADVALPYAIDKNPSRLTTMTRKSLDLLDKHSPNGFFVMIEGSLIDWCGHDNDIACAMTEMDDFAGAVELAKAYVDTHPDTLLVVTADHSTGGLSIGSNGDYAWHADVIKGVKASSRVMAQSLIKSQTPLKTWYQLTNIELDKAETTKLIATISAVKSLDKTDEAQLTLKTEQLEWHLKTLINHKSNTGWTTTGHTAIDVPVFAYGNGFEAFYGYMDNTDIAKKLISLIQNLD